MSDYLVLHVSRYDFVDRGGQQVRGCSIVYLDQAYSDSDQRGYAPLKVSADYSLWQSFSVIPARYDLAFRQKPDAKGKPTLALVTARLLDQVDDLERELAEL